MYFLQKGAHQLNRLHDEFSCKDNHNEIKEIMERESNLFQTIARFNDFYLYSEDDIENKEIHKLENEIFEWIEYHGFTEDIKRFFDKE
ncbi:hypothetical protein D0466_01865 [Peribacillus glennii]|uniref:Uncharacterized protein n=1 Tax=Peribacillus glennii TaxID=2303991 RepID=A0A372LEH2_9BACI|nr:hypothetical protein D0466_01865 [Peribacillus glennii]